ncbi:MAG TPA: hypothetical protein VLG93_00385, partial [Sulfuricaulis sp.]|nr:hypothetical protein [Sulfuricaulis sp.]
MSLINKMLQDLESRNTAQADTASKKPVYEDLKPLSRVPAPRTSSRRLPLMLLATVAVVGAVGYAWTQWGQHLLSKPADPIAARPASAVARKATPPRPAPVAAPAAAPAAAATAP